MERPNKQPRDLGEEAIQRTAEECAAEEAARLKRFGHLTLLPSLPDNVFLLPSRRDPPDIAA